MGVPFLEGTPKSPSYSNAVQARRSNDFYLNYCKTLIHVMQLTKGSSHYNNVSNKPAEMANIKHNWNKHRNSRAEI